jgi:phospholipase/lecithinase/hemolysin
VHFLPNYFKMFTSSLFLSVASFAITTSALAVPNAESSSLQRRATLPFDQIVAFGDELSDNGNGSYAHGITGSPATVYGFGTWTNGPVAVSYLNDLYSLGANGLRDYAFGGCCGGGSFGATLDNTYTKSQAGAPSLVDQIANYSASSHGNIYHALQFIWIGENDLSEHTDAFYQGDPANTYFAGNISTKIAASVQTLLNKGAPYVMVANIYPKQIAPVTAKYLCGTSTSCVSTWGAVIKQANTAIQSALTQFGSKVIYYDSFGFITNLANNATANGFTKPLTAFCDGDGDASWTDCMVNGNAPEYFWMNFIQPTTRVHQLIAKDMKATIDKHFGL